MRIIVVQTTDQNKNKEEMVIAVYLPTRDWELFLAVLALFGLVVFQPGVTLIEE